MFYKKKFKFIYKNYKRAKNSYIKITNHVK